MSDVGDALIVDEAGTSDDHLGLLFLGQTLHLVVVDQLGLGVDTVEHVMIDLADPVGGAAVSEVAALIQTHAQDLVTGLQNRSENTVVGSGAGVGLDVDVLGAKELLGTLPCQLLNHVGHFAAGLEPLSGITFQGLVGEDAAGKLHYRERGGAFRGDHLDVVLLTIQFLVYQSCQLGIGLPSNL